MTIEKQFPNRPTDVTYIVISFVQSGACCYRRRTKLKCMKWRRELLHGYRTTEQVTPCCLM